MNRKTALLGPIILFCLQAMMAFAQGPAPAFPVLNLPRLEGRVGELDGVRLFMNVLRMDPTLLDDDALLKHFMALNNCEPQNYNGFMHAMGSEFDYPKMAEFYKARAPEILKGVPTILHLGLTGFQLGQYDSQKGSFPFLAHVNGPPAPTVLTDIEVKMNDSCGTGQTYGPKDPFPLRFIYYRINIKPINVTEVRMDEASARKYVATLGKYSKIRPATLYLDLDVVQDPAKLRIPAAGEHAKLGEPLTVGMAGEMKKITVLGAGNYVIGVIFP